MDDDELRRLLQEAQEVLDRTAGTAGVAEPSSGPNGVLEEAQEVLDRTAEVAEPSSDQNGVLAEVDAVLNETADFAANSYDSTSSDSTSSDSDDDWTDNIGITSFYSGDDNVNTNELLTSSSDSEDDSEDDGPSLSLEQVLARSRLQSGQPSLKF